MKSRRALLKSPVERDRASERSRERTLEDQRVKRNVWDRDQTRETAGEKEREPERDYKRDPERRAAWDEQRESERARYAEITERKTEYRRELRESGLAPQIATSLAAFRAAQERIYAMRSSVNAPSLNVS